MFGSLVAGLVVLTSVLLVRRGRKNVCRRCRSPIRRWFAHCPVCGAKGLENAEERHEPSSRNTVVGFCLSRVSPVDRSEAQSATNAAGDLWAENMGDAIWLWWENQSGTTEYLIYRSTSSSVRGRHWAVLTKKRQERVGPRSTKLPMRRRCICAIDSRRLILLKM